MSQNRTFTWPAITLIGAVLIVLIAMPQQWKQWTPGFIQSATLHYGLDLAGGTQLDFRISQDEIEKQISSLSDQIEQAESQGSSPETLGSLRTQYQAAVAQRENIVEAIRTVLERRINALGVSEATITPSYIGNEKHLLVECPGIVDTQVCIETVGKTIQLEFKEEFTEATDEFEEEIIAQVDDAQQKVQDGISLEQLGQDLGDELGIAYQEAGYFLDTVPDGLDSLWNISPESGLRRAEGSVKVQERDQDGEVIEREIPGIFLAEAIRPRTQTGRLVGDAPSAFAILEEQEQGVQYAHHDLRNLDDSIDSSITSALRSMTPGDLRTASLTDGSARLLFLQQYQPAIEEMSASHILVSYKGAGASDETITRSKEEALAKAMDLKGKLDSGAAFESLAQQESDGPSGERGGSLGSFGRGAMVPPFEEALLALKKGEISSPVETQFGYHIIRMDSPLHQLNDQAQFDELIVTSDDASSKAEKLLTYMQRGNVKRTEEVAFFRSLFFSLVPTGWQDTQLDGKHFRAATVTLDPITNIPVVQIMFDDEGGTLFQELTKRNIDKRIAIFVGGELVSAPTVQQEIAGGTAIITGNNSFDEARALAQDLNTGAIPAPIHLSGQRTVEATLGAESLRTSLHAALVGALILALYMLIMYRFLGLLAAGALTMYAIIFLTILKLPLFLFSGQHIVLTLAGMAGIILSIGMAVDANVLIFERMKEELRKGKMLRTAVETGFTRAWPSIRDSNISTFITCTILFLVGTSIVRGFAVTLGMGVLISMFSAIVIMKWILRHIADTPLAEREWLWNR
jgi:protein-export membrane protein SecD